MTENADKMSWAEARHERRTLKQKLYEIRQSSEGFPVELNAELRQLKKIYEALPGFTCWTDFPDKWDIGDPNHVKRGSPMFNDIDKTNVERILGKSYHTIVHLASQEDKEE